MKSLKLIFAALCLSSVFPIAIHAQTSGNIPPPPPVCASTNSGAIYTNTGTSPATVYTCSYYNLAWQWVVNPSYGGLVLYPTVPSTCEGALPVFLAGWPNTQMYVCENGFPVPLNTTASAATVTCTGNDTTALQNALTATGYITVKGACGITSHLTIYSNTVLNLGTASITYSPSSPDNLLVNQAASESASVTFTDGVTTAGSKTLTSTSQANFTAANIGQSLECDNAYGVGAVWWESGNISPNFHTTITNVASTISVTLADAPNVSINPATCHIYNRDHNIAIVGGSLYLGGVNQSSGAIDILRIKTANDVVIDGVSTYNGTSTSSSDSGGFNIYIADANNVTVRNAYVHGYNPGQDGVHVTGPARAIAIDHLRGHSGDDAVSFTQANGTGSGEDDSVQGVIDGAVVSDEDMSSYQYAGVKLDGPTGQPMLTNNVTVRDLHGQPYNSQNTWGGFAAGVLVRDGQYGNVTVENSQGLIAPSEASLQVWPSAPGNDNIQHLSVHGLSLDSSNATPFLVINGAQIGDFDISNVHLTGAFNGAIFQEDGVSGGSFMLSTINRLEVSHLQYDGISTVGPVFQISGTIDDFILDDVQLSYALPSAYTGGIVMVQPGKIGTMSLNAVHVAHTTAYPSGVGLVSVSSVSGTQPTIGAIEMNDVSLVAPSAFNEYLTYIGTTNLSSYNFNNIVVANLVGCVAFPLSPPAGQISNVYATNTSGCGPTLGTSQLADWTDTGVTNGYTPVWNSTTNKWTPGAVAGTVTDGSGTATAALLAQSNGTAHQLQYSNTITAPSSFIDLNASDASNGDSYIGFANNNTVTATVGINNPNGGGYFYIKAPGMPNANFLNAYASVSWFFEQGGTTSWSSIVNNGSFDVQNILVLTDSGQTNAIVVANGATTATNSDNRGHITLVSGTGSYTFHQGPGTAGVWTTAPVCIIQDDTTMTNTSTSTKSVTTSTLTITGSAGTTDTYSYICWPGN